MRTGLLHGMRPSTHMSTYGLADLESSPRTEGTSHPSFTHLLPSPMGRSSSMTVPCALSPQRRAPSCCIKSSTIPSSTDTGSRELRLSLTPRKWPLSDQGRGPPLRVATSILESARTTRSNALSGTSASTVPVVDTSRVVPSALEGKERERSGHKGMHPKFARDLLWEEDRYPAIRVSAELSKDLTVATPMPMPPARNEFHPDFLRSLDQNPDLFAIETPIKVDRFEYLLSEHPNRPFVSSVIRSLREGAWPWAEPPRLFPMVHDVSYLGTKLCENEAFTTFAQEECDKEARLGRFSRPFPVLLPGMVCMPTYIISRKDKLRMVTDHSTSNFSLNSLISKENRAVPLCGLQQLGYQLRHACAQYPSRQLVLFKCDVKSAYRLIPMHPLWQMLQAVCLPDGRFAINRNNVFGGGASGRCWWSVMSLILWVAAHHYGCRSLLDYVDDVFSHDFADAMVLYPRYRVLMPRNQRQLLVCFDDLDVPHDPPKQTHGVTQPIIGMQVDATTLSITMPPAAKAALVDAIDAFCTSRSRSKRLNHPLRKCQAIAGHVNWALNVFPRLRPGLASLYGKMGGPYVPHRTVHVNADITRDLLWLVQRIRESSSVFLLQSIAWHVEEADLVVFTDACLSGLGFWSPQHTVAYYSPVLAARRDAPIFFHEAFAVACAIHWACHRSAPPGRLVIKTDSMNTVDLFNTLRARHVYNEVLKFAVDELMACEVDMRVVHVQGQHNQLADFLSRGLLVKAQRLRRSFKPKRISLPRSSWRLSRHEFLQLSPQRTARRPLVHGFTHRLAFFLHFVFSSPFDSSRIHLCAQIVSQLLSRSFVSDRTHCRLPQLFPHLSVPTPSPSNAFVLPIRHLQSIGGFLP